MHSFHRCSRETATTMLKPVSTMCVTLGIDDAISLRAPCHVKCEPFNITVSRSADNCHYRSGL